MTYKDLARRIASHFRTMPKDWAQGKVGYPGGGCCVMGAASAFAVDVSVVRTFSAAFKNTIGVSAVEFNDIPSCTVERIIAACNEVAAS